MGWFQAIRASTTPTHRSEVDAADGVHRTEVLGHPREPHRGRDSGGGFARSARSLSVSWVQPRARRSAAPHTGITSRA